MCYVFCLWISRLFIYITLTKWWLYHSRRKRFKIVFGMTSTSPPYFPQTVLYYIMFLFNYRLPLSGMPVRLLGAHTHRYALSPSLSLSLIIRCSLMFYSCSFLSLSILISFPQALGEVLMKFTRQIKTRIPTQFPSAVWGTTLLKKKKKKHFIWTQTMSIRNQLK